MPDDEIKSVDDVDLRGRNVLLRTDLNLPIEDGEPRKTVRFERYMETVKRLSEEGARVTVVAHQGRPARKDFLSLEEHANLMSDYLNQQVEFIQCFFGDELGKTVGSMDDGDVLLLENIRFLSEELQNLRPERHAHDYFVENMAPYFDLYINDAFSAVHRSHGSLVGFVPLIESCAGPVMRRELESCRRIRDELESPLLVLGGEKPSDLIGMMEQMIDRAEKVLLGGIPGELALKLQGHELGKKSEWIEEQGFDGNQRELMELVKQHREKIVLPVDVRTESGNHSVGEVPSGELTWDIGEETQEMFVEEIEKSDSIVMKGPMGAFDEGHGEGTRAVVNAIADNHGFTVLGGGHTSSLVHRFDHKIDDFTHVSIAGGAFVRYMSGEKLPGVEALKKHGME